MTVMVKRWYRSRRNQLVLFIIFMACLVYYTTVSSWDEPLANFDVTRRSSIINYIENRLEEALKLDKGTGCEIPQLDPYAKEVTQFEKDLPKVVCQGKDWVKCYHSECRVKKEILNTTMDIICSYSDIVYDSDLKYHIADPVDVYGSKPYILTRSDHVKVKCTGRHMDSSPKKKILSSKWVGVAAGFRNTVKPKPPPPGVEDTYNVLIFGFDSTAKNGFIRRMPKSYKYLQEELGATVLDGYNILGDGTPAALFPILSGKNELEFPDVRRKMKNNNTLDVNEFIFSKLGADGYRTAYFEDSPSIGTFQYRFNGFNKQPADHYLRAFFSEDAKTYGKLKEYCVGDTPRYKLMMDLTHQFLKLDGKKFIFTFIADITHNNFNQISTADEDTVQFLKTFKETGRTKDTLLFVMGDHGPRYANTRSTLQGRLEERLPLMAVRLPDVLTSERPSAAPALRRNTRALTTPHDVHATVLDALGRRSWTNTRRVKGAELPRALTLLKPIPKNRSCSEAGIEPHWCACLSWKTLDQGDPLYQRAADALVAYINKLTDPVRANCLPRTITSISWVMKKKANDGVLSFSKAKDMDGYVGVFGPTIEVPIETYQAKITVAPGEGVFEGSLTYRRKEDKFEIDIRDISRTNKYNHEPDCIHLTHPHLNMFCYCKDHVAT